jgi:hypothetical protein
MAAQFAKIRPATSAIDSLGITKAEFALVELGEIQKTSAGQSFLLCDLNRNWWEIEYAPN